MVERSAASTALSPRFPRATIVGTQADCRLKKERFSISIVPLKVSPSEKAARAPATTGVCVGRELAALVEQTHDRLREHRRDRARRKEQEADLAQAERDGLAEADRVAAGGEARQAREEHGRDGDREHSLREHVDAKGGVDRTRRELRVDEARGEERVDDEVEVDEPDRERHGQHERENPLDRRVAQVDDRADAAVAAAQPPDRGDHLDDRPRQNAARVHVELGLLALETGDENERARR